MLSNNHKSSTHSTAVSTRCQDSKYHQLLHNQDSIIIINQTTVNMVSNKTIMFRKKIIVSLNLEKALMVRPEADMKWMVTINSQTTKTKRISTWTNLINRFKQISWVSHKLSIVPWRVHTYLIALIFTMKTLILMAQCSSMDLNMETSTIVDSITIHIEMINLIWDINNSNSLIKIKDRITKEAIILALKISTTDEQYRLIWELKMAHRFTQINNKLAGAWVE